MEMQQQTTDAQLPFWMVCPPNGFTAHVVDNELARMQKSKEAKQLNGCLILGLINSSKPKR